MGNRPGKPVLQPRPDRAPYKKPAGAKNLPPGGPPIVPSLPGVPGDPSAGGQMSPQPEAPRSIVDANSLHTVTSYERPDQRLYGSGEGLGPSVVQRPGIGAPPPRSTGAAKNA